MSIYGHVCCPNCGMILQFTTEVPANAEFENSREPFRREKIITSSKVDFESMSAQISRDIRGAWARVYRPNKYQVRGYWPGLSAKQWGK